MTFTTLSKTGKITTELTDLIVGSWRKFGKQPNPQQKDPNVASFFTSLSLVQGSLYFGVKETGANKKSISFYVPQDSVATFVGRFGKFVNDVAKDGTGSCVFLYKNKEGVEVKLSLYAVVDKATTDGSKMSYIKTTIEQGTDKIEFSCSLARQRSNYLDRGQDFFASLKAISDAMYATFVSQSNGIWVDHFFEVQKVKKAAYTNESYSSSDTEAPQGGEVSNTKYDYLD